MKKIVVIVMLVAVLCATQLYAENKIHNAKTGMNHSAETISMPATDEINVANVYDALVWLKNNTLNSATVEEVNAIDLTF